MKTCLITGFEPFGSDDFNPSEALVHLVPEQLTYGKKALAIETLVLPVTSKGSWKKLHRKLRSSSPDILILCGLATGRPTVTVERFALNVRDYPIPDNDGEEPQSVPIKTNGPAAIQTKLKVEALCEHLDRKGYTCKVSNHAGTFVCNDVYYRALRYGNRRKKLVLFVHLPMPENGKGKSGRAVQVELMKDTVLEIARFCAEFA